MKIFIAVMVLSILAGCSLTQPTTPNNNATKNTNANSNIPAQTGVTANLSSQGLTALPSDILKRTDLQELDISNNDIGGALPGEIRFLAKLKVLKANDNRMTGVPAEIGQLSQLEVLNLANNQLTGLPNEIGNLSKLRELDLRGNKASAQDLQTIRLKLPNTNILVD